MRLARPPQYAWDLAQPGCRQRVETVRNHRRVRGEEIRGFFHQVRRIGCGLHIQRGPEETLRNARPMAGMFEQIVDAGR